MNIGKRYGTLKLINGPHVFSLDNRIIAMIVYGLLVACTTISAM